MVVQRSSHHIAPESDLEVDHSKAVVAVDSWGCIVVVRGAMDLDRSNRCRRRVEDHDGGDGEQRYSFRMELVVRSKEWMRMSVERRGEKTP